MFDYKRYCDFPASMVKSNNIVNPLEKSSEICEAIFHFRKTEGAGGLPPGKDGNVVG